jgi:dimethylargininase
MSFICCKNLYFVKQRLLSSTTTRRFQYSFAIAREFPESFAHDALVSHCADTSLLSMELARRQHSDYLRELRRIVPTLCLPALEDHPDCCFVEDAVVAIGGRAVLTRPGHSSRQGEVESIGNVLSQLGMDIVDMRRDGSGALCDGGDVMYTGRHLFVGLSNRTNQAGAEFLQAAFRDDPLIEEIIVVPPVVQGDEVLHLKSAVTHIDSHTLLAPRGPIGDKILEAMNAKNLRYQVVRLLDVLSCNVVSANNHILAQDTKCSETRRLLETTASDCHMEIKFVDTSELAKKDGALTCCSTLLSL